MKKTQLFTLLVALLFISCSQNDENSTSNVNPPSNSIKKITETTYIAGSVDNLSADFNYENGILKSISDATHKIELSYNGANISSSIIYNNNVVSNAYSFNYNGTFLETILNTTNNFERTLYTYSNGMLTSEKNQSLINSNWQTVHTSNYEFTNGNISTQYDFSQINTANISKFTHDYDTKLNPMNYMNPVVRNIIGLESCDFKNTNNEIKQYRYSSATSTTPILDFTYQITYNSQNLPITIKKYTSNAILVSEATFQYN